MDFPLLLASAAGAIVTLAAAAVAALLVVRSLSSFKKRTSTDDGSSKEVHFQMETKRKQETHKESGGTAEETLEELGERERGAHEDVTAGERDSRAR